MKHLWLMALMGCAARRNTVVFVDFPFGEEAPEAEAPSGRIIEDRFVDDVHAMSVPVPSGWTAEPTSIDDALRMRMTHAETGAQLELWAFSARLNEPAPRPGCQWLFQDSGPYTGIPSTDLLMVSTCVPDDPNEPRVQAWLIYQAPLTWQVELHLPAARFSEARQAGDLVLHTIRF